MKNNKTTIYCTSCKKKLLEIETEQATFTLTCTECDTEETMAIPIDNSINFNNLLDSLEQPITIGSKTLTPEEVKRIEEIMPAPDLTGYPCGVCGEKFTKDTEWVYLYEIGKYAHQTCQYIKN